MHQLKAPLMEGGKAAGGGTCADAIFSPAETTTIRHDSLCRYIPECPASECLGEVLENRKIRILVSLV